MAAGNGLGTRLPYLSLNTVKYAFETEVELVRSKMADRKVSTQWAGYTFTPLL